MIRPYTGLRMSLAITALGSWLAGQADGAVISGSSAGLVITGRQFIANGAGVYVISSHPTLTNGAGVSAAFSFSTDGAVDANGSSQIGSYTVPGVLSISAGGQTYASSGNLLVQITDAPGGDAFLIQEPAAPGDGRTAEIEVLLPAGTFPSDALPGSFSSVASGVATSYVNFGIAPQPPILPPGTLEGPDYTYRATSLSVTSSVIPPAPKLVHFQGRLQQGSNLVNGAVGLSLRVMNGPSGGPILYEDSNNVTVVDGLYATYLGDNSTTGDLVQALGVTNAYLEVVVNGTPLAPRERIGAAPYALIALNAYALGGQPVSAFSTGTPVYVETDPVWTGASNLYYLKAQADLRFATGTPLYVFAESDPLWSAASNGVASLATNVATRLASNAWALADATTNYVKRTGDTLTGQLLLPAGGLVVGASQLVVSATGGVIATGTVTAAGFAGDGSALTGLSGSQLATGSVSGAQLADDAIAGAAVQDGSLGAADIATNTFWETDGNAGTSPGVHFLGTTDGSPLEVRVNNTRGLLIQPFSISPNVTISGPANAISTNTLGSSIGGGDENKIGTGSIYAVISGGRFGDIGEFASFSAIGGGDFNKIGDNSSNAKIGGGAGNQIFSGSHSAIGGGTQNKVLTGSNNTIPGGDNNKIVNTFNASIGGGQLNEINEAPLAVIDGGIGNLITTASQHSAIGGGTFNKILDFAPQSVIGGGSRNIVDTNSSSVVIGGGTGNRVGITSSYTVVAGGFTNVVGNEAPFSTVGGGRNNRVTGPSAAVVIGGGAGNRIDALADDAVIAGGASNRISDGSSSSTISGGAGNVVDTNAPGATIAGGVGNRIDRDAPFSVVAGGLSNRIANSAAGAAIHAGSANIVGSANPFAIIGGGVSNRIDGLAPFAIIGGGEANNIEIFSTNAIIGGGRNNRIGRDSDDAMILGGAGNSVSNFAPASIIVGGLGHTVRGSGATIGGGVSNAIRGEFSVIDGGLRNQADSTFGFSVIGGGRDNAELGGFGVIGGGTDNIIAPSAGSGVIAGGNNNSNAANAGVIGGGFLNKLTTFVDGPTIAGGGQHTIARAPFATIGGGKGHDVFSGATNGTVAGGAFNTIGSNAVSATVGGGEGNAAGGRFSTVPGGADNLATGAYSFAAGRFARAMHDGAFVWADSTLLPFGSSNVNEVAIRAGGGVRIVAPSLTVVGGSIIGNGTSLTNIAGSSIQAGTISNAQLAAGAVNSAVVADGSITVADVATNAFWSTTGNSGTVTGTHFVGTTDNVPVEFRANNVRVLRLEDRTGLIGQPSAPIIVGGYSNNVVGTNSPGVVIAGGGGVGFPNEVGNNAGHAVINGGLNNTIGINARASVIAGGENNTIGSNSSHSVVLGGENNAVGASADHSLAAGRRAKANHAGSFVWADNQNADFTSSGSNQFLIRATGGVGVGTTNPLNPLHVSMGSAGLITPSTSAALLLEGSTNVFASMLAPNGAASGILFGGPIDEFDASVRYNFFGGRELIFRTLNSTRMTILTNGFIGIGTTAPQERTHVNGNLVVTGFTMVAQCILTPVGATSINPPSGYALMQPLSNITLGVVTAIANGTRAGQMLTLEGSSAFTSTVPDNANTRLGASRPLGTNDILQLIWNGLDWVEISFSDN